MADVTYTFQSISFLRIVPAGEFPRWFKASITEAFDLVLDSSSAFSDTSGTSYEPMTIRASFTTQNDLDDMLDDIGESGTLATSTGRSVSARLLDGTEIYLAPGYYVADLTFRRLS